PAATELLVKAMGPAIKCTRITWFLPPGGCVWPTPSRSRRFASVAPISITLKECAPVPGCSSPGTRRAISSAASPPRSSASPACRSMGRRAIAARPITCWRGSPSSLLRKGATCATSCTSISTTRALAVNPYQRARKALLKDYVPPSTSVLMEELLVVDANMDLSMLAVLPGQGREPQPARVGGVPVPQHSGFIPSLVCGEYVFVAGQMPNNEAMTALEPAAYRAPNAVWNGTDIRLQSEFIITGRLKPALEAGGSSLANAIKAQVYLTDINDLPEFMDVWNGYFGAIPIALTRLAP